MVVRRTGSFDSSRPASAHEANPRDPVRVRAPHTPGHAAGLTHRDAAPSTNGSRAALSAALEGGDPPEKRRSTTRTGKDIHTRGEGAARGARTWAAGRSINYEFVKCAGRDTVTINIVLAVGEPPARAAVEQSGD